MSETDWEEAFSAAAVAGRPMGQELTARGLIGTGELEALLRLTLADAVFALASGTITEYRSEPGRVEAVLPLAGGEDASWLLAEAARRVRVLESLPGGVDQGWVAAAAGAHPADTAPGGQALILALANGRRTARDIAFAAGYGLYATRLQLARMHQARLVVTETVRGTRPHPVQPLPGRERRMLTGLPWRSHDTTPPARRYGVSERRAPLNLLRPRSAREPGPDAAS